MSIRPQDRQRRKGEFSPIQLKSLLKAFRPAGAVFVHHLAVCERCRSVAARVLSPVRNAGDLSPFERAFAASLSRLHVITGLRAPDGVCSSHSEVQRAADLPVSELLSFLGALDEAQTSLLHHLITCRRCRLVAARTLAPKRTPCGASQMSQELPIS